MEQRIEVDTIFGKLSAEVSGDPNYPGINICIEQKDRDGKYNRQLAVAECSSDIPKDGGHALRLLVWNSDNEDYTDKFTFMVKEQDKKD